MESLELDVNGTVRSLRGTPAHTTTLDYLRDAGLTGSKEGCAEGECGACAILVARPGIDSVTEWVAVNACLVPAAALDGQEIVTSEGLGRPDDLHPVQEAMARAGGSQCGYCTPGFVCSMASEYYRPGRGSGDDGLPFPHADHAVPTAADVDGETAAHGEHGPNGFDLHALSGNLCRCTGYRPIQEAAYGLGDPSAGDALAERRDREAPEPAATELTTDGRRFVRPETLDGALRLLADNPNAVPIGGSTDWGVEVNLRGARADLVIALDRLDEMRVLDVGNEGSGGAIEIGAGLTLSEVERRLDGRVPLLAKLLPQFASRLIRNNATIGGNLGTGSPIGDMAPGLLALGAEIVLAGLDDGGKRAERCIPLAEYFTGYRKTVRAPGELIRALRIPAPLAEITAFHKIAKRRFDDISSVSAGFAITVAGGTITEATIGLGGVAATPIRASATEEKLVGRPWSVDTMLRAASTMELEGTPLDDHRASAAYRKAMLRQALIRLYSEHEARTDAQEVGA